MQSRDIRAIISSGSSHPLRIVAAIAAVAICFCAICAYVLIDARRTARDRAGDAAASLASAIEADLVRNIETLNLSLQAVVDNLKRPDIGSVSPELRQLVLFDRAATARHLGAILVLDETGHLRFDSRTATPKPLDLSDRDYFKAHRDNRSSLLYIGHPQAFGSHGDFLVGISKRLSHADGSFAGVAAGTLRLSHFKDLFESITLGTNGNITLARTDGTILMRWPFDRTFIGRNIRQAKIFEELKKSRSGRFETEAATDGVHRLIAYRQISDLPIVVGVGQATADIDAPWRKSAWTIGLLLAALCTASAMLILLLLRDLERRNAAERKLATLATTDGLTGLSNRWHFDQTIRREWRRAQESKAPLALLMIDTDLFKDFNDRHGHQAGDLLLKTIGETIASSIRRGSDLGARYGGDEFVVLLADTPLEGAERVADRIRGRFEAARAEQCISPDAGFSIGVACLVPDLAAGCNVLIEAADNAMYRAKRAGRRQTLLAGPATDASQAQDEARAGLAA